MCATISRLFKIDMPPAMQRRQDNVLVSITLVTNSWLSSWEKQNEFSNFFLLIYLQVYKHNIAL